MSSHNYSFHLPRCMQLQFHFAAAEEQRLIVMDVACSDNLVENHVEIKYVAAAFSSGASVDQQHCTGLIIAVHYILTYSMQQSPS